MYAIRSYYGFERRVLLAGVLVDEHRVAMREGAAGRVLARITSYNVCYTKLLRPRIHGGGGG